MKLSGAATLSLALGLSQACLLPHERGIGKASDRFASVTRAGTGFPIGKGDRFSNGTIPPQGLGTNDRNLNSILTVDEVFSGLKALAAKFPAVKLFDAPYKTYENRTIHGAVISSGPGNGEPRAFIQSGLHARERGGPDNVLYFIADLLTAAQTGKGVTYGKQAYTAAQVKTALSAGIVVIPLTNPDGVQYDQQTGTCWRKNRNPKSATGLSGWGVDLNRNFDFMWDLDRFFDPQVVYEAASDDPTSEVFHGSAPASEPEVQNIQWLLAQHRNVSWFLDLHSFGGDVLFSWGDDNTQTSDPAQNFANPKYDGGRGGSDDRYREFMDAGDYASQRNLSQRMCGAMARAGSVKYVAEEASALYPTSGASTDYALGLYYGHVCGANRVQGLTLEFGNDGGYQCPFYPSQAQYHESMRQVGVGLMEFLLTAAGPDGEPKHWTC